MSLSFENEKHEVDLEDGMNPFIEVDESTLFLISNSSLFETTNSTFQPDFSIHHPVLAIILGIMCLAVVFGNLLVMIAIRRERYLQTVTNYFVASLAAADCLVGLVVMPFSVVHEVMNKSWIFGQDWCDLWHSLDVLASTASILNLCVISMDRYWAITDPLSYPCKLTSKRAKVLIAVVWTCSSLISFPAIIWWRMTLTQEPPEFSCLFTEDIGYLVFSSIISFYGPLTVMIYVYYRIYRAATEQTRSIKAGSKNVATIGRQRINENSPDKNYGDDNGPVVLRIHRGGFTSLNQEMNENISSRDTTPSSSGRGTTKFANFFSNKKKNSFLKHSSQSKEVQEHVPLNAVTSNTAPVPATSSPSTKSSMDTARAARNLKAWSMGKKFSKFSREKKAAKTLGKSCLLHESLIKQ